MCATSASTLSCASTNTNILVFGMVKRTMPWFTEIWGKSQANVIFFCYANYRESIELLEDVIVCATISIAIIASKRNSDAASFTILIGLLNKKILQTLISIFIHFYAMYANFILENLKVSCISFVFLSQRWSLGAQSFFCKESLSHNSHSVFCHTVMISRNVH